MLERRVGTAHRNAANIHREGGQCPPYQSDNFRTYRKVFVIHPLLAAEYFSDFHSGFYLRD